jgi:pSer/pThr/pTyr-binding forkhead associated (FHA) protein
MKRKSSFGMDKTQPALLVQHGNTAQKHRPLDRAAVTLGQARGCDIELDAPEVSTVHCVITRGPDGLFIRDCNSRMGTRVNGERIKEGYLHDADILQVGPFSFQVYLPPGFATQPEKAPSMNATGPGTDTKAPSNTQMEQILAAKETELQQQEESLQKLQQDLERQRQELDEGNRQLEQNHRSMQEENNKIHAHAQHWEKELAERQAKADKEIEARMEECRQKCAAMEKAQAQTLKQATPAPSASAPATPEQNRSLEIRQNELDKFAKHLQSLQQKLREQEAKLKAGIVSDPTPAKVEMSEEFKQSLQEILSQAGQHQAAFGQVQETVQRQHNELIGALVELHDLQKASADQQGQEMEILRQTHQMLQGLAARREQQAVPNFPPGAPNLPPIAEPPQTPPPELKGRDKLAERLRAIDAKIPAVGSRQSRHD